MTDNFDWKFYIKLYEDLILNNINTEESALKHWNTIGKSENRICNKNIKNFNWEKYLLLNPDLIENNINTEEDAVIHWIKNGIKENRVSCENIEIFDWKFYIKMYDDLKYNNIDTEEKALNHWNNIGKNENRICNKNIKNFNWEKYLLLNADLIQNNINTEDDAVIHWLKMGKYENRIFDKISTNSRLVKDIEKENKENESINEENESIKIKENIDSISSIYSVSSKDQNKFFEDDIKNIKKESKNNKLKIINEITDLNSDEKSDPISDIKSDLNSDVKSDLNSDIKSDLNSDVKSDLNSDLESDLNSDLKSDLNSDLKSDSNSDLKSDSNSDLKSDSNSDLKSDLNSDLKSDLNSDVKSDSNSDEKSDLNSDEKSDLKSDSNLDEKSDLNLDEKSDLNSDEKSDLNSDEKSDLNLDEKSDLNLDEKSDEQSDSNSDVKSDSISESNKNEKNNVDDYCDEFCDELFDWEFYVNYYNDLKNVLINKENAYNHWLTRGKTENRYYNIYSFINTNKILIENNFDWIFYIKKYNDLNLTINNEKIREKALYHWILIGKNEGRYINKNLENNFDWIFYKNNIKNKNINSESDALSHYYNYGIYDNIPYKSNKLKYSIVIVYNNNKNIIIQILNRFEKKYKNNYNYEIIIVDNASNLENILDKSILDNYCFDIKYLYLDNYEINNSICYNKGLNFVSGNIIIIQNAECLHLSNILENIKDLNFKDSFYIVPTISSSNNIDNSNILNKINNKLIYSENKDIKTSLSLTNLDNIDEFTINSEEIYEKNIIKYLENESYSYKYSISKGWINHSKYLNDSVELTCLIISKENLDMLEGFNETYCMDYSYEYNELLYRAKNFLILNYLESSIIINLFYDKNILSENSNKLEYDNLTIDNLDINKKKYDNFINSDNKNISWKIYENYFSKIYYNNFNIEIIKNNKTINNTFITFIIPSIGRESLIDTVNSLLNLNNKNWKAIIIFDRVDNKFNINDNRISIIEINYNNYKINKSSFVRNIGLKNIDNTEWVAFVDDDDYISPDYIECFINELKANNDLEACIFRMGYKNKFVIPSKYDNSIIKCKVGISFVVKEFIAKKTYFKDDLFEEYLYLKELDNNNYKIIISEYVTYFVKTEPFEAEKYKKVLINF
jgi:hypothetical protein